MDVPSSSSGKNIHEKSRHQDMAAFSIEGNKEDGEEKGRFALAGGCEGSES